ncbi:MAG: hypothetical protein J5504_11615 [Butyrivibrio sp.]|nr:hypothetical protein [Butyrivibrio sp.]
MGEKTRQERYLETRDDIKIRVDKFSEHNRAYYQEKAKELGYKSMNMFAISSFDYVIEHELTAQKIISDTHKTEKK